MTLNLMAEENKTKDIEIEELNERINDLTKQIEKEVNTVNDLRQR